MGYKTRKMLRQLIYHVCVLALGALMVYPILLIAANSFKSASDIAQNPASLIPVQLVPSNYAAGWKGFAGISFSTFFKNSFIITMVGTLGEVLSSAVVAYGFARIRFKGRGFWFICMLLTLMLPSQVLIIPRYILFNRFGWLNTWAPMLVPCFFGYAFFIFLIVQFIQGIPAELDEAAYIDGCSKINIFFYIIMPLIVPALITSMIFSFYWKWDEFMAPLLYLQDITKYPLSMALKMFSDPESKSNYGAMYAMSTLSLLPPLLLFFFNQKYLVEGITTSGLKG